MLRLSSSSSSSSVIPDEESFEALPLTGSTSSSTQPPTRNRAAAAAAAAASSFPTSQQQRSSLSGMGGARSFSFATSASSSFLDEETPPLSSSSSAPIPTSSTASLSLSLSLSLSWRSLLVEQVLVWTFALLAWNVPRYVISHDDSIRTKSPPFQVTAAGDVLLDSELNRPLVDPPTINDALLIGTSLGVPLALIVILSTVGLRMGFSGSGSIILRRHLLHASLCGFVLAIGLSEGATLLLKYYVQRRRPNFYALCEFDKVSKVCASSSSRRIRDAHFSFPSGHSSLVACGLTFLALFLLGRAVASAGIAFGTTHKSGHYRLSSAVQRVMALGVCVLLPLGWAVFVGTSRIVDGWHHPSDVLAGWWLGGVSAIIAYHTYFPPWWVSTIPWSMWGTISTPSPLYPLDSRPPPPPPPPSSSSAKLPSFAE